MRGLVPYFRELWATDVYDYGVFPLIDFLIPGLWPAAKRPDWIITNPPFRLAEQFIDRARAVAGVGCAMLVRSTFLEGVGRYERLFSLIPPTIVAPFAERVPMVKGRCDRAASTATAYSWLVWVHGMAPQPVQWIPPCRAKLERDSDYPATSGDAPHI